MKTAQQWQKDLDLDGLPDAELLALLNEISGMGDAPVPVNEARAAGLASELNPETLEQEIEELYTAETVGAGLAAARGARHLSARELARRLKVSNVRIVKLEQGLNAELSTVGRYAGALGYKACLMLKPEEGGGPVISVPLNLLGERPR